MAENLARALKEQICSFQFDEPRKLAVPNARFTPPPEAPTSVPKQYLNLVGDHAAHPGTGKGRSYHQRHNNALDTNT